MALALLGGPVWANDAAPIRILSIADPFALVLSERLAVFEDIADTSISIELTGYTELRRRILLDAFAPESSFDLIAIDMGWGREVKEAGLVVLLDDLLAQTGADLGSFTASSRDGAMIDGQFIGLPVQPHAEVLFYDRAVFDELGLAAPKTTEDVLRAGALIQQAGSGTQAAICWNAQRGAALGQTMLHLLAAFGGRPLDAAGRATLDTPEMHAAIGYAVALLPISPSDILSMAWDERIEAFAAKRCAMTYGWTGRTLLMQRLGLDVGAGKIGTIGAPHAPGVAPVSPLGTWLLALPANIAEDRREPALKALIVLTSEAASREFLKAGVGSLLHTGLLDDPELGARNQAFQLLGELEARGELQDWMRPNISQFQALSEILGTEVYAVLIGRKDTQTAAAEAQAAFARLLEP